MGTKFLWLKAKTKTNLNPESKMKLIWNSCERELGGMKSDVNTMKAATKSSKATPF